MSAKETANTVHTVISMDGTTIGYRQFGGGPGVILIHGGLMTSQNFTKLAGALSNAYTVYVPDRRGRGLSGPHGADYCLARECEDINAIIKKTGAQYTFGLSSGAIVALQCALIFPSIRKAAFYEPPIPVNGARPNAWAGRYESELAAGKLGAAVTSCIKGTADSWSLGKLPRFILEPLMNLAIKEVPKNGEPDFKALIPTMHFDSILVTEAEGKIESFKNIKAEALLLGGSRSMKPLTVALDALGKILPQAQRVEFPGIGHLAADNSGKPDLVATELKRFFGKN